MPESRKFEVVVGGKTLTIETGKLAMQAGGAVTLRLADTMIFAAATMSETPREGIDFFPLTVDYEERLYAGGRIPGSFFPAARRVGSRHPDGASPIALTAPLSQGHAQRRRCCSTPSRPDGENPSTFCSSTAPRWP
jgi:hypothetical protein